MLLMYAGEWERAWRSIDFWDDDLVLSQGLFLQRETMLGQILWYQDRREAARPYLEQGLQQIERWETANRADQRTEPQRAKILAMLGNRQGALAAAERAMAHNPLERDAFAGARQREILHAVYALLGDEDEAIQALRDYLALPGSNTIDFLLSAPEWHALRDHPDVAELEAQYSVNKQRVAAK